MELEEKINNFCSLYVIEAEHVGGRHILRNAFTKLLGKHYDGYPSLFILANGAAQEIPYETMWSKKLNRFDTAGITAHIKKYLLERKLV
tara:strand:- start:9 stop:275 length:267 start_codon:yes stop_codon:yes gene_type:complete